jgi:uncharacterized protein YndB with AHSA1/START domain
MIRLLLRLTMSGAALGWIADRFLAVRAEGRVQEPIRSMVVIDARIGSVWDVLADVEGQPRWMHDMKSVRLLTPGAIRVGTRAEGEIRIFGIGVRDPITISAFEPPRRFAILHEGRFSGHGLIELEPGADGETTIVRWEETLVSPVLPHLSALVLGPILGRVFQRDLESLRDLVETSSAGS